MIHSRVANWVLACALAPADREPVVGDLAEEYAIRARSGLRVHAALWYWGQVFRSVLWFLWTPISREGWFATLRVALVACTVQAAIEVGCAAALRWMCAPGIASTLLIGLLVVLCSLFLVSFFAARMRAGAGTLLTVIAAVSALTRWVVRGAVGPGLWSLAVMAAAPSAALAGATMSLNLQKRVEAR